MKIKKNIISLVFIVGSLIVYGFFPVENIFQQIITTIVFFVVLPILFNKYVLKELFKNFHLQIGDWKKGLKISGLILGISLIIIILLNNYKLLNAYHISNFATEGFINFVFYEFVVTLFFILVYEFYFRGFIMFILQESFNYWAILIQALIFLVLVLCIGGTSLNQFMPYLLFAPFAGFIAYKSRSLIYSSIAQFIVILILDIISVKRIM